MPIHIILPNWANIFVSLPVLLITASLINWLTAIWMLPVIKSNRPHYTAWHLTLQLSVFSILAGICGILSAGHQDTLAALSLLAIITGLAIWKMKLPKWLGVIACAISFATFFVGQVAVTESATIAFLLELSGVITTIYLAMFVVMLNSLGKRTKK
jgi:hypothetical protein